MAKKNDLPATARAFTFAAKFDMMPPKKILVVDNYDSFTYNLVNILRKSKQHSFEVQYADRIDISAAGRFDLFLFSPGPDIPHRENAMHKLLEVYGSNKSFLGICLGFQAMAQFFGAKLVNLPEVFHGQECRVSILDRQEYLFSGIPDNFNAGLYHSWAVLEDSFPDDLVKTAKSSDGVLMGLRHRVLDIRGVQFHPESIMTPQGEQMIANWLA
jgi:anthranilate synthase component 2